MPFESENWVTLARIVRPQGRRGEVLADLLTDFPEQFGSAELSLLGSDGSRQPVRIESHWMPTGRNAGRVVLKPEGVDTISEAESLSGAEVQLAAGQRLALDDHTYYVSDLVGCTVEEGDVTLGTVQDVHFALNPDGRRIQDAAPIFVVARPNGDELLVPFANEFIERIDVAAKRIVFTLPQGLLELNG